jgi:hypothetical protein
MLIDCMLPFFLISGAIKIGYTTYLKRGECVIVFCIRPWTQGSFEVVQKELDINSENLFSIEF